MAKKLNLKGQVFGEWVVLSDAILKPTKGGKNKSYFLCKCSCGNQVEVLGTHLKNGKTKSCGCLRKNNLTGQVFSRWTVIKEGKGTRSSGGQSIRTWVCQCDCGVTREVNGNSLTTGKSQSCGCLQKELISKASITHGQSDTRTYATWRAIKERCLNPNNPRYESYKNRGICKEWENSFEQFYKDMGPRPGDDYSIDRIDNDLEYSKDNCRWVKDETGIQQINQGVRKDNTSGTKGVYWYKSTKKWRAEITVNKERINLGTFETKEEAIQARREAEVKYHAPLLKKQAR